MTEGEEDRLVIALEPEAASVWCKKLPADGFIRENHGEVRLDQTPGTQYIVVDCGGTLFFNSPPSFKRGILHTGAFYT